MVLAEGLDSDAKDGPAGRPVHPPDQLPSPAHGNGALRAAGAFVVHRLAFQIKARDVGGVGAAAATAYRIKGAPALRYVAARDLFEDAGNVVLALQRCLDGLVVLAFFVKHIGAVNLGLDAQPLHALQEGLQKMVGVAGAASRRAGYFRERLSNVLCEALRQEGVEPAQAVVGVGDVDELSLHTPVQKGAVDGFCRHDLAHVSDMNRPGGGYARGNGVRAALLELLGDDVSPMNRHNHQSRRETNINLALICERFLS